MKHCPDTMGIIHTVLRFAGAFLVGAVISLLFCIGVGLIFFAAGAITHTSYLFRIGPLLLLRVDASADRLNLLFGSGTAVVIAVLGLFNGVSVELLRRRRSDRISKPPLEGKEK